MRSTLMGGGRLHYGIAVVRVHGETGLGGENLVQHAAPLCVLGLSRAFQPQRLSLHLHQHRAHFRIERGGQLLERLNVDLGLFPLLDAAGDRHDPAVNGGFLGRSLGPGVVVAE